MKSYIIRIIFCFLLLFTSQLLASVKISTHIDKESVWLKQQILYSVTIAYQGKLENPYLTPLVIPNAMVKQIGDVNAVDLKNDHHTATITWAIYPLQLGKLLIPSLTFTALQVSTHRILDLSYENRSTQPSTAPIAIEIKTDESIIHALPCPSNEIITSRQLSVYSHWEEDPNTAIVGKPYDFEVTMQANSFPGELLPILSIPPSENYEATLLSSETHNESNADGIHGRRIMRFRLTPKVAGNITLPALPIHWWDTSTGSSKTTTLPALYLNSEKAISGTDVKDKNQLTDFIKPNDLKKEHSSDISTTIDTMKEKRFFKYTVILFGGIFSILIIYYCYRRKLFFTSEEDKKEKALWVNLQKACTKKDLKHFKHAFDQWSKTLAIQTRKSTQDAIQIAWIHTQIDQNLFAISAKKINFTVMNQKILRLRTEIFKKSSRNLS